MTQINVPEVIADQENALPPAAVVITSVTPNTFVNLEVTEAIVVENVVITIAGTVDLGVDQNFILPFTREDTGATILVSVSLVANAFSATVTFPSSGTWEVSEVDIVSDPATSEFSALGTVAGKRIVFNGLKISVTQ